MDRTLMKKKYFIKTWGCQMNIHDSEKISGTLSSLGYSATNSEKQADLIVFNTCCVREHAELKVYGNLGRLKKLKEQKGDLIIVVCGCMMQQKEVAEHIADRYPFVDIIFGTDKLHKLAEFIANAKVTDKTIIDIRENAEGRIIEGISHNREERVKAWVAAMHGCDNYCSYCIVPYVRGRERSRQKEHILKEVRALGQSGYKEITLLGQNVNSYGKGMKDGVDFAGLLREVNNIGGIERIRFMTSHPKDLSNELIYAIRDCNKVCEHIHLPFQAGSNKVLFKMNRKYTKEQYLDLIDRIKAEIPKVSLTTDIIVGFPGESEEDFRHTLDVVKRVRFDSAFTFIYSKRSGTPAAKMEGHVPKEVKHDRLRRLLGLVEGITTENSNSMKGEILEVLVEGVSKTHSGRLTGRTRTNRIVHFEGKAELIGELVDVKITEPRGWFLIGEAIL